MHILTPSIHCFQHLPFLLLPSAFHSTIIFGIPLFFIFLKHLYRFLPLPQQFCVRHSSILLISDSSFPFLISLLSSAENLSLQSLIYLLFIYLVSRSLHYITWHSVSHILNINFLTLFTIFLSRKTEFSMPNIFLLYLSFSQFDDSFSHLILKLILHISIH